MSASAPCVPCCSTPQSVNVPGIEGDAGTNGTNGENAFTTLTAPSAVPVVAGNSVTFTVASSLWAIIGMNIVVGSTSTISTNGPSTYRITAIPSATSITAVWLASSGDVAGGSGIATGAGVTPVGASAMTTLSVYASGTAYSLTNAAAQVVFGTTSPALTLTAAGTYLLFAQFRIDYTGATFVADRTITMKLRRSNNTAADITDASIQLITAIVTTVTQTFDTGLIPIVAYTTVNTNDSIELWGSIGTLPSAGSMDVAAASIIAVKIV